MARNTIAVTNWEVYCKCKRKIRRCAIAISAIDRACEWLTETNPIHKNIEEMLGTPSWQIVIHNMQQIIQKCPFPRDQHIHIGWSLNKKFTTIFPIQLNWMNYTNTSRRFDEQLFFSKRSTGYTVDIIAIHDSWESQIFKNNNKL